MEQLHKAEKGHGICMAGIREVARLAQVAPSTVSRALNGSGYVAEETKEKIRQAVSELEYVPNQWIRNLYRKKTGIIGVLAPELIHPYFSSLWSYLEIELHRHGYNMMLCNTGGNPLIEREYLDTLERNLFDGMIIGAAFLPDEHYTEMEKVMISLDRIIPGIPLVTSNHVQGGELAALKMTALGCKKVLQLSDPEAKNIASAQAGAEFIRRMKEAGAEVITEHIVWDDTIHYHRAMRRTGEILTKHPGIDGIMANDLCAAAFLKTAVQMGIKVPEKLHILGYDGTFVTDFNAVSISTIVQNVEKIAVCAVEELLKRINKQPGGKQEVRVDVYYKEGETL